MRIRASIRRGQIGCRDRLSRTTRVLWNAGVSDQLTLSNTRYDPELTFSDPLLDHLVGNCEQRWWHLDAERSCRLQVDDELELGRLLVLQAIKMIRRLCDLPVDSRFARSPNLHTCD